MGGVLGFLWLTRGCHSVYSLPPPTTFPGMLTTGHRSLSTIEQPLTHVNILKCPPASQSGYRQSVILIGTLSVVHFFFQDFYQTTSINLIPMMLKTSKGQNCLYKSLPRIFVNNTEGFTHMGSPNLTQTDHSSIPKTHTTLTTFLRSASATPASGVKGTTMLQGRHTCLSHCNCLVFLTLILFGEQQLVELHTAQAVLCTHKMLYAGCKQQGST